MGNINITDKAISKIQEVLKEQNMKYFRIRVKGGGCSGFQYVFTVSYTHLRAHET